MKPGNRIYVYGGMIRSFLQFLYREKLYRALSPEDEFARQQFILFRIFSLTGSLVCTGVFVKMMLTLSRTALTPWLVFSLGLLMLGNYFAAQSFYKLRVAYFIMMVSACVLLHIVSYDCGGIMTGGSLYWSVVIIYAYLLLGKKTGSGFAVCIALHLVYLYMIHDTGLTSFSLFKNDVTLISQDFLVNGLLMTYLVASLCNYLQSGRNVVVQSLKQSKAELEKQFRALEEKNRLLNEYTVKLEQSNRELEKFASVASHDLKAPLRAIGNTIGMIEQDMHTGNAESTQSGFTIIKGRVNRMEGLLNGLLRYAKISRSQAPEAPTDLEQLIQQVFMQLNVNAKAELSFLSALPVIYASQENWRTIFTELIRNSIQFSDKESASIRIGAVQCNDSVTIIYSDNGPGIPARYHEKVFIIFQTLQARDERESAGIGLALVKKCIESEGASISIQEQKEGIRFEISIPGTKVYSAISTEEEPAEKAAC